jgi:hypothetical protein
MGFKNIQTSTKPTNTKTIMPTQLHDKKPIEFEI